MIHPIKAAPEGKDATGGSHDIFPYRSPKGRTRSIDRRMHFAYQADGVVCDSLGSPGGRYLSEVKCEL